MRGQSAFPHGFGFDPSVGSPALLCRVAAADPVEVAARPDVKPIIHAPKPIAPPRRLPCRRFLPQEREQMAESRPSMVLTSCVIGATLAASTYFLGYL